jgi:hypothetical protein
MICALRVSWCFVRLGVGPRGCDTCLEYGKPWVYSLQRAYFRALWMGREVSDSVGQKV